MINSNHLFTYLWCLSSHTKCSLQHLSIIIKPCAIHTYYLTIWQKLSCIVLACYWWSNGHNGNGHSAKHCHMLSATLMIQQLHMADFRYYRELVTQGLVTHELVRFGVYFLLFILIIKWWSNKILGFARPAPIMVTNTLIVQSMILCLLSWVNQLNVS